MNRKEYIEKYWKQPIREGNIPLMFGFHMTSNEALEIIMLASKRINLWGWERYKEFVDRLIACRLTTPEARECLLKGYDNVRGKIYVDKMIEEEIEFEKTGNTSFINYLYNKNKEDRDV